MTRLPLFVCRCALLAITIGQPVLAASTIPPAYRQVAADVGVKPDILYAIALAESGYTYRSRYLPWPWTLNIEGRGYRFSSRHSAYHALKEAIAQQQSVDVGVMEVNWTWHGDKFGHGWASLDPWINLTVGAGILFTQYQHTQDWWIAVGKYHAPGEDKKSRQRAQHYRQRVFRLWQQLGRNQ